MPARNILILSAPSRTMNRRRRGLREADIRCIRTEKISAAEYDMRCKPIPSCVSKRYCDVRNRHCVRLQDQYRRAIVIFVTDME